MGVLQILLDVFHHGKLILDLIKLFCYAVFVQCEAIYRYFVPPPIKSLIGEVILITGAGNGIGKEICLQLSRTGATLVLWDINKVDNDNTLYELRELGTKVYAYEIDISDRSAVETIAVRVRREIGDVSMIINNAGIMACQPFLNHNPNSIERVFKVNVFSHFWILREFLPKMIENNHGHIVTLCSAAGLFGTRNVVPYCATKHAVHGYVESLRDELAHLPTRNRIKITTVYPGAANTGLFNNVATMDEKYLSVMPLVQPKEIAEKLVDGMRRNYEYVYCPDYLGSLAIYGKLLHPKTQRAAMDTLRVGFQPTETQ